MYENNALEYIGIGEKLDAYQTHAQYVRKKQCPPWDGSEADVGNE